MLVFYKGCKLIEKEGDPEEVGRFWKFPFLGIQTSIKAVDEFHTIKPTVFKEFEVPRGRDLEVPRGTSMTFTL